ncbi:MAG: plastocyanin/azurin family copper-binding protein [Acidobacteriota bacterium]
MRRLVIFIGVLLVTSASAGPARSDPRGARARYATQSDIERLEREIAEQRALVDKLVTLQTQYLKSLAALAQNAPAPPPPPPEPKPVEHATVAPAGAPEPQPAVAARQPAAREPAATRPKPASRGVGTILGRVKGGTAGETYVYVEDLAGPLAHGSAVMKQQNKQFVPRALVVQKGTQVEFPNMDAVFHNVFSVTPDNSFDLGSYRQGESKSVHMTKAGVVSVYCNMHPEMVGYILVVPGAFYARVGQDGFYKLAGVPAGHHRIVAWTPNAKPMVSEVDVTDTDPVTVELELHASRPGPHTNKDGMAYGSYRE